MKLKLIFCGCVLLMLPVLLSAGPRLNQSYTGYPVPESLILGFHYTGIHPTNSGEWPGNNNGLVYPFPTYGGQIFDYKYTNAGYIKFIFPYYGVPHSRVQPAYFDRFLMGPNNVLVLYPNVDFSTTLNIDWANWNLAIKNYRRKGNNVDIFTIYNGNEKDTLPSLDRYTAIRTIMTNLPAASGLYTDVINNDAEMQTGYYVLNEVRPGQKLAYFQEYGVNPPWVSARWATTCAYWNYCSPQVGADHAQNIYRGHQVTGFLYPWTYRYCFFWNNYTPCVDTMGGEFNIAADFFRMRKKVLDVIDATGPNVPIGLNPWNVQVDPGHISPVPYVTLYGGVNIFIGQPDKRVYTFFGPAYNNAVICTVPAAYEVSTRWVSLRESGDVRTPIIRNASGVNIVGTVGVWNDYVSPNEDICIVNFSSRTLDVGRSSRLGFDVTLNKTYTHNLILNVEFTSNGVTRYRRMTVINQKVKIDLGDLFGISQIESSDIIRFKLYREFPLDDVGELMDGHYWEIHHFICDEVILKGSEIGIGAEIVNYPTSVTTGNEVQIQAKITNYNLTAQSGVQVQWTLPSGWQVTSGNLSDTINLGAYSETIVFLNVVAQSGSSFGIQRLQVKARTNQETEGVEINSGVDSKMVFVDKAAYWDTSYRRIPAGIETGGWAGPNPSTGVIIPVSITVDLGNTLSQSGKYMDFTSLKVFEYDTSGNIIQPAITCQFNKSTVFNSTGNVSGEIVWTVDATANSYRNFYVYFSTVDTDNSGSYTVPEPLFNGRNITVAAGNTMVTQKKFKFCSLEMSMKLGTGGTNNTYIGWQDSVWDESYFLWRYKGTQLDAIFDNGTGQPEVSSGWLVTCPDGIVRNVYSMWGPHTGVPGDYGWPDANTIINKYNTTQYHTYNIEWRRTLQQWHIDKELAYEREIVLPYENSLLIQNNNADSLNIAWLKINSVYARPAILNYVDTNPYKIAVTASPGSINADGMSISTITAQIQDTNGNNIIMTSIYNNNKLTGTASADSVYQSGDVASKANDGIIASNGTNRWHSSLTACPHWWQVDFGSQKKFWKILVYHSDIGQTLTTFKCQYWDAGSGNWIDIPGASVTGQGTGIASNTFTFSPITSSKVRIYITATPNGYGQLSEVVVYEYEEVLKTIMVNFTITGQGTWDDGTVTPVSVVMSSGAAVVKVKSTVIPGAVTVQATVPGWIPGSGTVTTIPMIPTKVVSNANPASITANGISISTITAELKDNANNVTYIATNTVTFSITGNGTWSDYTLDPKPCTPVNGIATIAVKSTKKTGTITVNADSYELAGSTVTIITTPGPVKKLRYKIY